MEAKTLLRLIKNDVAHLEEITSEFNIESLPSPDEVDVALVRANALLRELEILSKLANKNQNSSAAFIPKDESKGKGLDSGNTKQAQFELFEIEVTSDISGVKEELLADATLEGKKTLGETLGESHQMVNDILSHEKSEPGYQIIPINSVWDGIGINDRFLFIRELFDNSSEKFETTVTTLDQLNNIRDAVSYLKTNFKWNKTETSQKFLALVKRRFTN